MARIKAGADIASRDARKRLKVRREPYFMVIESGLSLGYRKSKEGGTWVMRRYDPATRKHSEQRIATANDHSDPDGERVMDFGQAQRRVLELSQTEAERTSGKHYTVKDAAEDYLAYLRTHKKSADDAAIKFNAYVIPELGEKRVADLKPADFTEWQEWALKRQARRKPKKPKPPPKNPRKAKEKPVKEAKKIEAAELKRRRKSTLNRIITMLKACLNYAHSQHKVPSREAWAGLKKFRKVDGARLRWLTVPETKRLINACQPNFRKLVQAGLLTGCREGELLATRARDFDPKAETLLIADSKSGNPRQVPLTAEGVTLFKWLTAGLKSDAPIFERAEKSPWHRVAIIRAMQAACTAASIDPPATFYALRHTYASHLVQQGTPLLYVASALGHRDTRMVEKHYGHFAPSHVAETIREKLPTFGIEVESNVTAIES